MASYTKSQILTLIADKIPDNTSNLITPAFVRDVLIPFTDMIQSSAFISHSNPYWPLLASVKDAIDKMLESNIPTWEDKDYPDLYTVYYNGKLYRSTDIILQGDGSPDASISWECLTCTGGTGMTGDEIVAALESLDIANALNSVKVRYSTGVSVYAQIVSMVSDIAARQKKLYNSRYFVGGTGESNTWTINGALIHPVTFFINGKYYNGRQAANFDVPYASYDYRYVHNGTNTEFYLNPLIEPAISFAAGDTIDIVHSSEPIGAPA
ncbi:MAG: hypothetical protein EOL88_07185 [Bacteroidia bacterium]|nr:hypothetical protein [Bacteroidia bacterium]